MTTHAAKPSDAPLGPIVRFVRRLSIGDGTMHGGALGCDAASPRLRGWMEAAGISTAGLSRWMDNATQWATADAAAHRKRANELHALKCERERIAKFDALVLLFILIAEAGREDGRPVTPRWLFTEAASYLSNAAGDLPAELAAQQIMESGIFLDEAPAWQTIRDVCKGFRLSQMLGEK